MSSPVRITHPFHPRFGDTIDVTARVHNWGEDRVYYRHHLGHLVSMPTRWTSLVPEDLFVTMAAGRSPFRVDDLINLAALIRGFRP